MILYPHFDINSQGHLTIGGLDTVELAREFGTPVNILDENYIRAQMRLYIRCAKQSFGEAALPLFASKALCCAEIYRIAADEGMGIDCVSPGELYIASRTGFPSERIYFHGNNKTDRDIEQALDMGVGTFVVDNAEELQALSNASLARGMRARILLRITPGIDPHTHKAISTGGVDSKFGSAIHTGQAAQIVKAALDAPGVDLQGFHCHIGSQIFDAQPFVDAAAMMVKFMAEMISTHGIRLPELNLGGGLGVRYTKDQPELDIEGTMQTFADKVRALCTSHGIPMPRVILEPGRSLVAAAGVTLYSVGSVKEIPGFKNYVSVDGGMADNPRYALYQSPYTALIANKADLPADFCATLAGRCCESGDLLGEGMMLQRPVRGDVLAMLVTGAYQHSMASNYNKLLRPPLVMVKDGQARVVVRRETFEDLMALDVEDPVYSR
ncbi:MAG: diaminopimelate decarboxylase [Ruminococcaceae bacterium]|nr:diaminopimelate decarboxylase [Oscillospiraceae bacterium]